MPIPREQQRLTGALRLIVALAGLVIYASDPSEHPSRRPFAQAVLILFVAYSLAVYLLSMRRSRPLSFRAAPWVDAGWVTLLVAVSEGSSSIFYPLYLFAILQASFGRGFRSGMAVAAASSASFAVVGALTAPRGPEFELVSFVNRPLYLLVLGYLTAVWGGHEVRSRARLALLREVTTLSNPRFGVDRTVARLLEALRSFYDAHSARLVVAEERSGRSWMRAATREVAAPKEAVPLPGELVEVLLPPPQDAAFLLRARRRAGRPEPDLEVIDREGNRAKGDARTAAALSEALEAEALLSVPFRYHATAAGRLHVAWREPRSIDRGDIDFLRHVLDQVVPVLENVRLVDRLASDAAEEERRRIARDLHDSVIQPYLGLRLGLSAARQALSAGRSEECASHLDRLSALAEAEVQTLRGYVRELRTADAVAGGGLLDAGLRRFCSRFSEATGIRVDVTVEGTPVKDDRLAAEVFQMVAEGLSNVRRHTSARRAEVRIQASVDRLLLTVTNDAAPPGGAEFFPRSLGERAAALGGTVRVESPPKEKTAVRVEIPL